MKDNKLKVFLCIYICIATLLASFVYGVVMAANGDNVEHLHTSWLIWQGKMPYRDFFQHHNPLMWYIFAPLVAALINQYEIFAVFNIISVWFLLLTLYFQSKIMRLNGSGVGASLSMVAVGISAFTLLNSFDYRPDTFMFAFFSMGLYFLLHYILKPNAQLLVISFFAFFIAFMFTQKVILNFIVPACAVLYWLYSGKIKKADFITALIVPVLCGLLFCTYMYVNGALDIYFKANFLFNTHIPEIFERNRIVLPPYEYYDFYIFVPLGLWASILFLKKGTMIERVLSLMYIEELILRVFYFSGFLHYCAFLLLISMVLSFMLMGKYIKRSVVSQVGVAIYLVFSLFYNYEYTYKEERKSRQHLNGYEYAFYHLTPCDYAINGYYSSYNLKAKDVGYYGILLGQIDVLGEKVGIAARDDLNQAIRTKLPKIIFGGIYWDTYWEQRGRSIPAHVIDEDLIKTYYNRKDSGELYILKPQYRKHICRYNGKSWEYVD